MFGQFSDISFESRVFESSLSWQLNPNWEVRPYYRYEKGKTRDWSNTGLSALEGNNLFVQAIPADYSVHAGAKQSARRPRLSEVRTVRPDPPGKLRRLHLVRLFEVQLTAEIKQPQLRQPLPEFASGQRQRQHRTASPPLFQPSTHRHQVLQPVQGTVGDTQLVEMSHRAQQILDIVAAAALAIPDEARRLLE